MTPWRSQARSILTLIAVLAALALAVGFESRWIDETVLYLVWAAFLVSALVVLLRVTRRSSKNPSGYYGNQIAWLPQRWQQWILGETNVHKSR